MVAFVGSVGMTEAAEASHLHDGGELRAAVAAGVAWFLAAFIEFVLAAVGTVGMAVAVQTCKLTDVVE